MFPTILRSIGSHIDRGANAGLAVANIPVLKYTKQCADIMGVGKALLNKLPFVTCARTVHMTQGPIVLIMHQ